MENNIERLAEMLWDAYNQFDYDPMHPSWSSFEDPIKDSFRDAASKLILSTKKGA